MKRKLGSLVFVVVAVAASSSAACSSSDGGVASDAGASNDAANDASSDVASPDATSDGASPDATSDGGPPDAPPLPDGGSSDAPLDVATDAAPEAASGPTVPTGLVAVGSLNHIALSWTASTGGVTGYNVYRSSDGVTFSLLGTSAVASYDDAIASPAGDGAFFWYRVTAVGTSESAPSSVVKQMHGKRVASSTSGFDSTSAPVWVAERSIVIEGGDFTVQPSTKVYVLDGATIDVEQAHTMMISGTLQVLASTSAPAHFTSHKVGGTLADGQGFGIFYSYADAWNAQTKSGNLLQNTQIDSLVAGIQSFRLLNSSPWITNCKITANASAGTGYLYIQGTGSEIDHNVFDKIGLSIAADLRTTGFHFHHNVVKSSIYAIYFQSPGAAPIVAAQIEQSVFPGASTASLFQVPNGVTVPLGNNYWPGGSGNPPLPATSSNTTATFDFTPPLSAAPAGAGPSW